MNIALVGCGAIAEIVSGRVYRRDNAGPRVVAAVDRDVTRARLIASATGAAPFPDLASAMQEVSIDGADIRTPHETHVDVAITALELGLHVLVEKPVAVSVSSALDLADAARSARGTVSVGENYGLHAAVADAAGLLASGAVGSLVCARSTRAFGIGPPWLKDWRTAASVPGGGVIMDQSCHQVRMLREVVGEIVSVQAAAATTGTGTAADVCTVNLRFADNSIGQMLLTWAAGTPPPGPELQLLGTTGSIEVHFSYDAPGGGCLLFRDGARSPAASSTGFDYYDSLDRVIEHWAEVVDGKAKSRISLADGIRDLAVAEAIVKSAAGGRWVDVDVPALPGDAS